MNKVIPIILAAIICLAAGSALASDDFLGPRLDRAAEEVAKAFDVNDQEGMRQSVNRLVFMEAMWLGVQGDEARSYLRGCPLPPDATTRHIAAWVWSRSLERGRESGVGPSPALDGMQPLAPPR